MKVLVEFQGERFAVGDEALRALVSGGGAAQAASDEQGAAAERAGSMEGVSTGGAESVRGLRSCGLPAAAVPYVRALLEAPEQVVQRSLGTCADLVPAGPQGGAPGDASQTQALRMMSGALPCMAFT
jgi:hypothetical protein